MGLFHRGKKNNDDEPDSVQTNSFSDIMNGLQYAVNCAQDTLQNWKIQCKLPPKTKRFCPLVLK